MSLELKTAFCLGSSFVLLFAVTGLAQDATDAPVINTLVAQQLTKIDLTALQRDCLASIAESDKSAEQRPQQSEKCEEICQRLEQSYANETVPEAVQMLVSILRDKDIGPGSGWFKPATSKYDWKWLCSLHGKAEDESISVSDFRGDAKLFARLDRNSDKNLQAIDLDWSPSNPWVRESSVLTNLFRTMDRSGDSSLTREEWAAMFDRFQENDRLGLDSFRRAVPIGKPSSPFRPGDEPSKKQLVQGFFASELGALTEGPRVGQAAPDFELKTFDHKRTLKLSDLLKDKPVVIVFGNYTCGPFRRIFPEFDVIAKRFEGQVQFVGVYVREAHPEDGWIMESNTSLGVKLPQPKSITERESVAQTCSTKLNYSFPLLVDIMDDRVGSLYSGMPARAYIIARNGEVVYQGGRGPFGFNPGEMEQSLIMHLIDDK